MQLADFIVSWRDPVSGVFHAQSPLMNEISDGDTEQQARANYLELLGDVFLSGSKHASRQKRKYIETTVRLSEPAFNYLDILCELWSRSKREIVEFLVINAYARNIEDIEAEEIEKILERLEQRKIEREVQKDIADYHGDERVLEPRVKFIKTDEGFRVEI